MHFVIFDIDGTLLHSVADDDRLFRKAVFDVLGDVRTRRNWTDYPDVTDAGIVRAILADNGVTDPEAAEQSVKRTFARYLSEHVADHGPFAELPGARRFLAYMKNHPQCRIAIATGCWEFSARLKLESAGFDTEDIPLATADDHPQRTNIMMTAISSLGSFHDSITYYGDGAWDRTACAQLGWDFVPVGQKLNGLMSFDDIDASIPAALRVL